MAEVIKGRVDVDRDRLVIQGTDNERLAYVTTSLPLRSEWHLPDGGVWEWSVVGWNLTKTGGAVHAIEQGVIAGGRNQDSTTNNYDVTHEEINKTFFNPDATTEQVISSVPCFFYGVVGKVGTGGTLTIRDSAVVAGSATDFPVYTLAVGTHINMPGGVRMESGLTLQCGTGTDEVTVFWRPL